MESAISCKLARLGLVGYQQAWDLQKALAERVKGGSDGWLLVLQHAPTYTFGRDGHRENLLLSEDQLGTVGAEIFWVDRAGDVTYHGPEQLIIYPIVDLHCWREEGVRWFVAALEQAIIYALGKFGINAGLKDDLPGIWVGQNKIAAIGLGITHGITRHGIAINVGSEVLEYFQHINSCGVAGVGNISMEQLLEGPVDFEAVAREIVGALETKLRLRLKEVGSDEVWALLTTDNQGS